MGAPPPSFSDLQPSPVNEKGGHAILGVAALVSATHFYEFTVAIVGHSRFGVAVDIPKETAALIFHSVLGIMFLT